MRLKKLITTAVITAAALMMTTALQVNDAYAASGWQKNNTGWWWENADGSYPANAWKQINGTWYYFNASGYMTTGWQKVGGTWYYMDSSGAMQTGWVKVGNTWYYMYSSGAMAANTVIDGYTVNADGAWVTGGSSSSASGWIQDGTGWWYRHSDGSYTTNAWEKIDGTWYYFNASGYMYTGWLKSGKYWYYLNNNGSMAKNTYIGDYYVDMGGRWLTGTEKDKYLQALPVAQGIAASIGTEGTDLERVTAAAKAVSAYCERQYYTTEGNNYYTAYGLFISREFSCAGATRGLGMVLECMGYDWSHAYENQWHHQWCILEMDGQIGWADGQIGWAGYGDYESIQNTGDVTITEQDVSDYIKEAMGDKYTGESCLTN